MSWRRTIFVSPMPDNLRERKLIRKSLVLARNEKERAEIDGKRTEMDGEKTVSTASVGWQTCSHWKKCMAFTLLIGQNNKRTTSVIAIAMLAMTQREAGYATTTDRVRAVFVCSSSRRTL